MPNIFSSLHCSIVTKASIMDKSQIRSVIQSCTEILAKSDDRCGICLDGFVFGGDDTHACLELPKCKHVFHKFCATAMLSASGKCGVCNKPYVTIIGDMPEGGYMTSSRSSHSVPGHAGCGLITITYSIPSGIQGQSHPNPGQHFYGTTRHAYLPDNEVGRESLRLLEVCFQRRLTFTVGTSLTTGATNSVIWNGVHHKTSLGGGPTCFGYPDEVLCLVFSCLSNKISPLTS